MKSNHSIKLLTVSDLHQSKALFQQLSDAVALHRPDLVACVGDVLDALGFSARTQFATDECAVRLAKLPVKDLLFVRGNHEDSNWTEFVSAWPHDSRPLHALYGSSYTIGPLVLVGFPCFTGTEFTWCAHLEANANQMKLQPSTPTEELSVETDQWLPKLLRRLGPSGRTLWLMHEPPMAAPLGNTGTYNQLWSTAVERFAPRLVVSGHDHHSPIESGVWQKRTGSTLCVNVGQSEKVLHYAVLGFEFSTASPSLPVSIRVQAFPRGGEVTL